MRWIGAVVVVFMAVLLTGCRDGLTFSSRPTEAGVASLRHRWLSRPTAWKRLGADDTPGIRLEHTTDAGRSWRAVSSPCGHAYLNVFISSPTPDRVWIVCTGEPGAGSVRVRVATSKDAGASWTRLPTGQLGGFGYPSGLSMTASGVGILTEDRGMSYATSDGGRRWRPLRSITAPDTREGIAATQLSATRAFILVFSGDSGTTLYRSTDGDRHWTTVQRWPPR